MIMLSHWKVCWLSRGATVSSLLVALFASLVYSQELAIETIPASLIYVRSRTDDVKLLCRSNKPVESCSVKVPGYPKVYDVTKLPDGLGEYGMGLQNGDCGVIIGRLLTSNEGKFECNLTVGGEVFRQTIDVVLPIAPEPTELQLGEKTVRIGDGFAQNQTLKLKCISEDGLPVASLSWMLDDQPLDSSLLGPLKTREKVNQKGKKLTTVEQELNYFITPEDNGKKIVCKADHLAFGKGYFRASLVLDIMFPPQRLPTIYVGESSYGMVNVTIKANPKPKTHWKVNGVTIEEGHSSGPYQAYVPRDMDNGNYLVRLRINEHTKQTEIYELEATNDLGTQTYVIKATEYRESDNELESRIDQQDEGGSGARFWLISLWTFFTSVIVT
ncbi:fasciclin-3-like isoform X2 [Uranotaenia lowii]|nr:fasciclin-3-like isoform X2 [Uranotaenia lowii]